MKNKNTWGLDSSILEKKYICLFILSFFLRAGLRFIRLAEKKFQNFFLVLIYLKINNKNLVKINNLDITYLLKKEFFKVKSNKNLIKIENVSTKIKWIDIIIY